MLKPASTLAGLLGASALLGACVREAHPRACSHYASGYRAIQNVPNCLLRDPDTLDNGLPPANPYNHM